MDVYSKTEVYEKKNTNIYKGGTVWDTKCLNSQSITKKAFSNNRFIWYSKHN